MYFGSPPRWVFAALIAVIMLTGWAVVEGVIWIFKHITIGWVR